MRPISEQNLLTIIDRRPENLLLVPTPQLQQFLADTLNDADQRRVVLAELVTRWCLSGNSELGDALARLFCSWLDFSDWYNIRLLWSDERSITEKPVLEPSDATLRGVDVLVGQRLLALFETDGFISVCDAEAAWFIPFRLLSEGSGITWADGSSVSAWQTAAQQALKGTEFACARLRLLPGPELDAGVTGASLMLPLHLAALRKGSESLLPKYDPLRVLATGALDAELRLQDVAVKQKLTAMREQFRDAVLFGPEQPEGTFAKEGRPPYVGLMCHQGIDTILADVRTQLERRPDLVQITMEYARRRLPALQRWIDRENHRRWADVAEQLTQLKGAVSARCNPNILLEFMSLLATALCHAGKTEECREVLHEALVFAHTLEKGPAKALRLQESLLASAQDLGDLAEIETLNTNLSVELEKFTGAESSDLRMRYYGTMAQAHIWGSLLSLQGFTQEAAFQFAKKAVETAETQARQVPADATAEKRDEAEANVAQDLNYAHLWQATFKPGTPDEEQAYQRARQQLNELALPSRQTNLLFLMRQRSLAYFNRWRATGEIPSAAARTSVRLPKQEAEGWMVASNRRHLGTLAAAAGEGALARQLFEDGEAALPLKCCYAPVLASIRMSLLAQAVLSLEAVGESEAAAHLADLAEETYEVFAPSKLFSLLNVVEWLLAVRTRSAPDVLPQFYY